MSAAQTIISEYRSLIRECQGNVSKLGLLVPLPVFSIEIMRQLCNEYQPPLTYVPIIDIDQDIITVGDIHGNLHNLLMIFERYGYPPQKKYLFLGNLVEFGDYSLEVVTLLLAYQIVLPNYIFILKGNTEMNQLSIMNGLVSNIDEFYGKDSDLADRFYSIFANFPISALVQESVFCCQPSTVMKYKSINEIENETQSSRLNDDEEIYENLVYSFQEIDDPMVNSFTKLSGIEFLLLGSCPEHSYLETVGDALFISSCAKDRMCIVPLLKGENSNVEVIDSPEFVDRRNAYFQRAKNEIKKISPRRVIIVPQLSSMKCINMLDA